MASGETSHSSQSWSPGLSRCLYRSPVPTGVLVGVPALAGVVVGAPASTCDFVGVPALAGPFRPKAVLQPINQRLTAHERDPGRDRVQVHG